ARFEEMRRARDARKSHGIEAAAQVVKDNFARQTMNEIRKLANEMKATELAQLDKRNRDVESAAALATYGIAGGVLLALLGVPLITALISRPISRDLGRLIDGAQRFGRGQLDHRVAVTSRGEIASLADAFNGMAEQRHQASEGIGEAIS